MKFKIATLGCKVNQYESEQIKKALTTKGYSEAPFSQAADLTIINTCTVTHRSDSDVRRLIRKSMGSGKLIVTGCMASISAEELRELFPEAEIVKKDDLENVLAASLPLTVSRFSTRTRAFVKIQDGCSNFCAFCIVPYARGNPSSRPEKDIITEINTLHENGCNEVVLCGINLGLYEGGFARILTTILKETQIPRIRISSIEPWTLREEFLTLYANPRICAHLHLPLQSGSANILASMGRPYTPDYYSRLMEQILLLRPETAIGTDIMAGFPGESIKEFEESARFVKNQPFSYMHVFPYSKRSGTRAAEFDNQVSEEDKKSRALILRGISEEKRSAFLKKAQESIAEILVTSSANGLIKGVSSNYITAVFKGVAKRGSLVKIKLESVDGNHMKGTLIG